MEVLESIHILCLNKGFIALYLGKGELGVKKWIQSGHRESGSCCLWMNALCSAASPYQLLCVSVPGIAEHWWCFWRGQIGRQEHVTVALWFWGPGEFLYAFGFSVLGLSSGRFGPDRVGGSRISVLGVHAGMATQVNSEINLKQRKIVGIMVIINCLWKTSKTDSFLQQILLFLPIYFSKLMSQAASPSHL